ncbi:murein hydrolase activator EnvC family protein [Oceanibaculum sp.]|uniref:murein hydrolase activator EnvC family protein n=1 Tax=Oceanibaculum sp. TaxID=1903597 RepID=UPI0025900806|nr:peptidoglycan DD-metalloendopeptidase family protein [Oceanibaculum sp.]MCH2394871.1 peptidoglycan DD-metalloendopeptidase family protein [Oceanibaculum sp.]
MPRHNASRGTLSGRCLVVAALSLFLAGSLAGPAFSQQSAPIPQPAPDGKLKAIEQALERDARRKAELEREAQKLRTESEALRADAIKVAKSLQEQEAILSRVEESLRELTREANRKRAALQGRDAEVAALLAGLQRLSRRPPEAMIASPSAPLDTVRGGILLRAALPQVQESAMALRAELEEVEALQAEIAAERKRLAAARQSLLSERKKLESLAADRRRLAGRTEAESDRLERTVSRLSDSANDLRDLLRQIEAEREAQRKAEEERRLAEAKRAEAAARRAAAMPVPLLKPPVGGQSAGSQNSAVAALPPASAPRVVLEPPSGAPRTLTRGALTPPVQGKLVHGYGERSEPGGTARGIVLAGRPEAVIVAPFDGQVVYAGKFRGYGQILIIDHGNGYHSLLAGLGRIDSVVGQYLLAGEPVGGLGRDGENAQELYLELRRNGEPINPLPWLAARTDRIRG